MKKKKICMISSSGGHYDQLRMLKKLEDKYDVFWVTEKTDYYYEADYYLIQTGLKDMFFIFKMIVNLFRTIRIWAKERPDLVITTGTMVVIPMAILAKILRRRLIYIETFAVIDKGTKTGKLIYKFADLFIIQWETLKEIYPNAIYGGSIY